MGKAYEQTGKVKEVQIRDGTDDSVVMATATGQEGSKTEVFI